MGLDEVLDEGVGLIDGEQLGAAAVSGGDGDEVAEHRPVEGDVVELEALRQLDGSCDGFHG